MNVREPHGISRNYETYPIHLPERRGNSLRHFKEKLEMRAVARSAWPGCVCNLHWLVLAVAIQGAVLRRLAVVPLRVNHYLTLGRKDLWGFLGFAPQKFSEFSNRGDGVFGGS